MDIELVAAVDERRTLGKNNALPWRVPQEMNHFKTLTMGGVLIMGRVTFESIGRALPGRICIVVTRSALPQEPTPRDVHWTNALDAAVALARERWPQRKIWIAGGAQIYEQMLDCASTVHLSVIPVCIEQGDAFFPALDPQQWTLSHASDVVDDSSRQIIFSYHRYERYHA